MIKWFIKHLCYLGNKRVDLAIFHESLGLENKGI